MSNWFETYRGMVHPWECDAFEHFTVAYYFDRFSDCVFAGMEEVGVGPSYMAAEGRTCATIDCHVRYVEELRAGDNLHIETGVIEIDEKRLRLGHKVYNSVTGALCATLNQLLLHFDVGERKSKPFSAAQRQRIGARAIEWDGEARVEHYAPADDTGFHDTARDVVKPWEIDVIGHMGFQFYVHRFTAGSVQTLGRMGLTPRFLVEERRGFSTFEFQLRFFRELSAGDLVRVKTGLMHLGTSSIRYLHRMYNVRTGELAAELSQFGVLLDLDARRPTAIPPAIQETARRLLVAPPEA